MSASAKAFVVTALLLVAVVLGCKSSGDRGRGPASNSNTRTSSATPDDSGIIHSGTGTEKERPTAGKANVQGKAFYNEKPAANIEVKLCEKFNQYIGGCGGQTFSAKTDGGGEYLIRNVPPGVSRSAIDPC